jgi:hypothetical protein
MVEAVLGHVLCLLLFRFLLGQTARTGSSGLTRITNKSAFS